MAKLLIVLSLDFAPTTCPNFDEIISFKNIAYDRRLQLMATGLVGSAPRQMSAYGGIVVHCMSAMAGYMLFVLRSSWHRLGEPQRALLFFPAPRLLGGNNQNTIIQC